MITCFRHYNIHTKSRSRIPWHYKGHLREWEKKNHFIGVSVYLEVESTNGGHFFYVSYWRRDRHFTWSSQPPEGSPAYSANGLPSFLSYSLKTVSRVRSRELNPRPPALQSNALPTELILSGLIIPESRSLPCYSFNASGSPL